MDEDASFADLLARVRSGDEQASETLLRSYEPQIRRVVRVRLTTASLRRQMDSMDICQSVMADFFVRVKAGVFELENPKQLIQLLAKMVKNRVIDHTRRLKAARRDMRRTEGGGVDELSLPGSDPTPSRIASMRELLKMVLDRLSAEERNLAEQRGQGRSWQELAEELGEKPDALRMRLSRALTRVGADVGLSQFE